MKLEVDKKYVTKTGTVCKCVAILSAENYTGGFPAIVLIDNDVYTYTMSGEYYYESTHPLDLISEYVEKPKVDWSKFAAWHNYLAMDKDGRWHAFCDLPIIITTYWQDRDEACRLVPKEYCQRVPNEYYPEFSGDWKDSLICRDETFE